MKKLFVLLVLFLIPITHADLKEWKIDISLNEDRTSQWEVTLIHDNNVTRSDYYILGRITGVEVEVDDGYMDCFVSKKELGTSILCEGIYTEKIIYRFRALDSISDFQDYLKDFKYRFSITQLTDKFSLVIKLPLGAGLVEELKLKGTGLKPFEPTWGNEGSDGRKIFISWEMENPKVGAVLDNRIIYEQMFGIGLSNIIIIFAFGIIVILALFLSRRGSIKDVLPILTESERKVMEILLKEKREVDQRRIVKELDYSKAKISRTIQNLVDRGLIERTRKGRTNLIKLRKIEKERIEK